ncbi:MAG: GAF domain-containing protein [Chloroflexales bacterium]|nr:GAF domain-containing protein [Chloroflexales bacterium]
MRDPTQMTHAQLVEEVQLLRARTMEHIGFTARACPLSCLNLDGMVPLDQITDTAIVTDTNWQIRFWNRAAEHMYRWSRAEALGRPVSELVPVVRYLSGKDAVTAQATLRAGGEWRGELVQLHRDGHELFIEASVQTIYDSQGVPQAYLAINRDISERHRLQAQVATATDVARTRAVRLQLLAEASQAFADAGQTLESTLALIARRCAEAIGDGCAVRLISPDGRMLLPGVLFDTDAEIQTTLRALLARKEQLVGEGMAGHVAATGEPLIISPALPGSMDGALLVPFATYPRHLRPHSMLMLPLREHGRVLGVLILTRIRTPRPYDADDLALARDLAERAALAISRARLAEELRASEERLRAILHNSQDTVTLTDPQGRFSFASAPITDLLGYSLAEFLAADIAALTHPEDLPVVSQAFVQLTGQPGASTRLEFRARHRNGTWRWLEASCTNALENPSLGGLLTSLHDVTERRQQLDTLRASEARYRALLASFPNGALLVFDHSLHCMLADGLLLGEFGIRREQIVGRALGEVATPELQAVMEPISRATLAGAPQVLERSFGGRHLMLRTTPLTAADGHATGGLLVIQDLTERKAAEEQLHRYARRMEVLHQIDRAILMIEAPQTLAETTLTRLRELIPCERASIVAFDTDGTTLTFIAISEDAPSPRLPQVGTHFASDTMRPQDAAFAQGTLWYSDDLDRSADPALAALRASGFRSLIEAPLFVQDRLLGILKLAATTPAAFSEEHRAIVAEVSAQLAIALQNAQLLERERAARQIAETLQAASTALARSLDLEHVLEALLDALGRLISFDSASVLLREDETHFRVHTLRGYERWTELQHVQGLRLDTRESGVLHRLVAGGRSIVIADTQLDPGWQPLPGTEHIRSWLGVPLIAQGQFVGLFSIDRVTPNTISDEDGRLAEALAATAGTAITNARLFAQAQHELAERTRAEESLQRERTLLAQRVAERTADLSTANAQLARAARLKDEFLASMSHELRTPLNAILGRTELLHEQVYGSLTEKQGKAIRSIEESGRHLLALINDILDLSKIEADKLELQRDSVRVALLCRMCLQMVAQTALTGRITVTLTIDPQVTTIEADERRLKQILVNLLSNAVKFTPEDGNVGLEVQGDPTREMVAFTVWDTGIGIAPDDQRRLFQPFVQIDSALNRQYAGTGLGLALVQRLAELHGGSVTLESSPGAGSRFRVALPWTQAASAEPAVTAGPAVTGGALAQAELAPGGERPVILLAEDHEENSQMLSDALTARGYTLVIARNGAEAVAQAEELRPALILMDIQMPILDGLEATRRIRAAGMRDIPIIVVTALAMQGDRERCLAAGANEYLAKPLSIRTLLTLIASQLQRAALETIPNRGQRASGNYSEP